MELRGAAALVTGGAAGIGRAVAARLAADGARVAVADVGGEAEPDTVAELGGLDVLVNDAGGAAQSFPGASLEDSLWTLDLNLRASLIATHLAVEAMRGRGGAVVNVSSVGGLGTRAYGLPDYGAAKAGLVRFTAALAGLAESDATRVSCICPDYVDAPAVRRSMARMSPEARAAVPPLVPAEEIAELVAALVRDDSSGGRIVVRCADEPGPRELPLGRRD